MCNLGLDYASQTEFAGGDIAPLLPSRNWANKHLTYVPPDTC